MKDLWLLPALKKFLLSNRRNLKNLVLVLVLQNLQGNDREHAK